MRRFAWLADHPARKRALLGVVLALLGLLLLGITERADSLRAAGEDALGGFVLTGRAAVPGPHANGRLVLVTGAPEVKAPAQDAQFGVAANVPALVRKVEMFQWNETRFGGEVNYELDWFDHPVDSSTFSNPATHTNPGTFPISGERFDSPDVTVGGFRLASALVNLIPGSEPIQPDLSHLPPDMQATFTAEDGTLVTSTDRARPRVGDLRVSWRQVAQPELTVFARDRNGTLEPANDTAGDAIAQVLVGRMGLSDVLTDAPRAPHFKWARRILALLLTWAGAALLLPEPRRRDRWLAFALALVPLAVIAAVYWFDVRMLVFSAMVIVAVLAAVGAAWRWRSRTGGQTTG